MGSLVCLLLWGLLAQEAAFETPEYDLHDFAEYGDPQDLASENWNHELLHDPVTLYRYKVNSIITSRLADTSIEVLLINSSPDSQIALFEVQIPKGAFISNFSMTVDGEVFTGFVKEKSMAHTLYAHAMAKGKTASVVRSRDQDMDHFNAEVTMHSGAKVHFVLKYKEVKWRTLNSYEHRIYLQPGRLAKHLEVDVWINEPQGIRFLHIPDTFQGHFVGIPVISKGQHKAHVAFKPTLSQQRRCPTCLATAVDGELVVMYDVSRENTAGELQASNGYFVHYFSPENMDPIPKNILFVIDVSGSMWGIKMKQTVEAMKTILDDLRAEDHFTVVDFNHHIRTWRSTLVPATKTQVASAKKYVEKIQPNGGTNINEALLRAISLLNETYNLGLLTPNSVSLIILVSDGDPTVGELKLSQIQKNVKQNIPDYVSLFSLGIGFDVDFDFLRRLSNDNQGIAQRVYGNQDTASQLKKFYNQVSMPLLRNVQFNYPQAAVTDVTQNSFHNYFGGSEILVAGKYNASILENIQSFITATSASADLVLEAVSQREDLQAFLAKDKHADPDFPRKIWAFLTINQLLAERSLAPTATIKKSITRRALQMSLENNIVTPLTAMVMENAAGDERMLADSPPMDPSCCSGALYYGSKVAPGSIPSWASPMPTQMVPMPVKSSPVLEMTPQHVMRVENDPHFIIYLPKSQKNICFNIDSEPGKILSLVSDPELGITVNGQLIGAKRPEKGKLSTYFGTLSFNFWHQNFRLVVTCKTITMSQGSRINVLSWSDTAHISFQRVLVSLTGGSDVTVSLGQDLFFSVLLHRVWEKHPTNVDFLGIYIPPTDKFSPKAHGLLGQFMWEPEVRIFNERPGKDPAKPEASMEVKGHKLSVTRGWQKDYRTDHIQGTNVTCWFVHNSGKGFIDGHYKDYLVPQLHSFLKLP